MPDLDYTEAPAWFLMDGESNSNSWNVKDERRHCIEEEFEVAPAEELEVSSTSHSLLFFEDGDGPDGVEINLQDMLAVGQVTSDDATSGGSGPWAHAASYHPAQLSHYGEELQQPMERQQEMHRSSSYEEQRGFPHQHQEYSGLVGEDLWYFRGHKEVATNTSSMRHPSREHERPGSTLEPDTKPPRAPVPQGRRPKRPRKENFGLTMLKQEDDSDAEDDVIGCGDMTLLAQRYFQAHGEASTGVSAPSSSTALGQAPPPPVIIGKNKDRDWKDEASSSSAKRKRLSNKSKAASSATLSIASCAEAGNEASDQTSKPSGDNFDVAEVATGRWQAAEISLLLHVAHECVHMDLRKIGDIAQSCGIKRPHRAIDKQLKRMLRYERWALRDQDVLRAAIKARLDNPDTAPLTREQRDLFVRHCGKEAGSSFRRLL